jgi:polysaccharide deacetylase family protein (PEP-CTERM system associated)
VTTPIIITVDFEDWFHVENLRPCFPHETWDACELRIESNARKLLELFEKYDVQATFFVLGWVAERCADLVREISLAGHEIASHGYAHRMCCDMTKAKLQEDLETSKEILNGITGREPKGYRAPNFSITPDLVAVLGDLGFVYDSSYNNFGLNKRYGKISDLEAQDRGENVFGNGVRELPVTNLKFAGQVLPWAGGGYFRLWPTRLFEHGVRRILRDRGHYVFYCHPWEIDPLQPRIGHGVGSVNRFRHYINLDKSLGKLKHFFIRFKDNPFVSCARYLGIEATEP